MSERTWRFKSSSSHQLVSAVYRDPECTGYPRGSPCRARTERVRPAAFRSGRFAQAPARLERSSLVRRRAGTFGSRIAPRRAGSCVASAVLHPRGVMRPVEHVGAARRQPEASHSCGRQRCPRGWRRRRPASKRGALRAAPRVHPETRLDPQSAPQPTARPRRYSPRRTRAPRDPETHADEHATARSPM